MLRNRNAPQRDSEYQPIRMSQCEVGQVGLTNSDKTDVVYLGAERASNWPDI